jgi:hypothetical protein
MNVSQWGQHLKLTKGVIGIFVFIPPKSTLIALLYSPSADDSMLIIPITAGGTGL